MRTGIRLGIDVGRARIGVARSDQTGTLAVPVETVRREPHDAALARVIAIAAEYEAMECVVGLPINLLGERTASTEDALAFAVQLADGLSVAVRTVDERLSTRTAARDLRDSGISSRSQRPLIDQQAAVIILQHALEIERTLGEPPGDPVVTPGEATQ